MFIVEKKKIDWRKYPFFDGKRLDWKKNGWLLQKQH